MATFENEYFPFPPVAKQRTIVTKLNALATETRRLQAIYQKKLADLDELKQSILHKVFSGELTEAE